MESKAPTLQLVLTDCLVQWSESNISYKGTSITRHLLPGLSDWELLLLIVETKAHWTRCYSRLLHIVCNMAYFEHIVANIRLTPLWLPR